MLRPSSSTRPTLWIIPSLCISKFTRPRLSLTVFSFSFSSFFLFSHHFLSFLLEFTKKRQAVIDRLQVLMEESKDAVDLFQDPEVLGKLRQDKQHNFNFLKENYGVSLLLTFAAARIQSWAHMNCCFSVLFQFLFFSFLFFFFSFVFFFFLFLFLFDPPSSPPRSWRACTSMPNSSLSVVTILAPPSCYITSAFCPLILRRT